MYMGNKNGRYIHTNEIENASSYLNLKVLEESGLLDVTNPLHLFVLH